MVCGCKSNLDLRPVSPFGATCLVPAGRAAPQLTAPSPPPPLPAGETQHGKTLAARNTAAAAPEATFARLAPAGPDRASYAASPQYNSFRNEDGSSPCASMPANDLR